MLLCSVTPDTIMQGVSGGRENVGQSTCCAEMEDNICRAVVH